MRSRSTLPSEAQHQSELARIVEPDVPWVVSDCSDKLGQLAQGDDTAGDTIVGIEPLTLRIKV